MSFVVSLVASRLSKFIHVAANDWGYADTRYELVAKWVYPLVLEAKTDPRKSDNPSRNTAMNDPFRIDYWTQACKETRTLEEMDDWEVVDRTDNMTFIDSVCAFKLKWFPDGLIKKCKVKFSARGDQQLEGVDFFETYASVVQWTTVRMMLILEIQLKLKSK